MKLALPLLPWNRLYSRKSRCILVEPREPVADTPYGRSAYDHAQSVNDQPGNYNRTNCTKAQRQLSKFVLFPGWAMSSMNWVIRHPIKTFTSAGTPDLDRGQPINAMGGKSGALEREE